MTQRYLCIHGHFYQPPRENPWLEAIEQQDSAHPYHDWNERISAECYAPNTVARVLDERGRVTRIVNNYELMSYNFGPTLLSWMQDHDRPTYDAVVASDAASRARFGGHSSAVAQVYNHLIMPLASERDRRTQVRWGLADYQHRLGHAPEGMWLAETAADLPSLEALAAEGIAFTILAPAQCKATRKIGDRSWVDQTGGRVDPSHPYRVSLPSGRSIAVFFYDGPISQAVAFEGLLKSGDTFARRLLRGFSDRRTGPQLVHIATDGETYGHHHRGGERALAYALTQLDAQKVVTLTNYGQHLERFPPTHEALLVEPSSWSCAHGVERWRSDCGCRTSNEAGWTQAWRAPLRQTLDWLRDELARRFEERGGLLLKDPWAARDDYIHLVLDRSAERTDAFLARHALRPLTPAERAQALKFLEMQRFSLLMFTSCGWFFDEVSRIEPVQLLQYADRAIELCEQVTGDPLGPEFLRRIERARSNLPEQRDGRHIHETMVVPARVALRKVAAHYALASLFEKHAADEQLQAYHVHRTQQRRFTLGSALLVVGELTVEAPLTGDAGRFTYAVLHIGDHNPRSATTAQPDTFAPLVAELEAAAQAGDLAAALRVLDQRFGELEPALPTLFRDQQRALLTQVLAPTLAQTEAMFLKAYAQQRTLVKFVSGLQAPMPGALRALASVALSAQLREVLAAETIDIARVRSLVTEAKEGGVLLDVTMLETIVRRLVDLQIQRLLRSPDDIAQLEHMAELVRAIRELPFPISFVALQDAYHQLALKHARPATADAWGRAFVALGEALDVVL